MFISVLCDAGQTKARPAKDIQTVVSYVMLSSEESEAEDKQTAPCMSHFTIQRQYSYFGFDTRTIFFSLFPTVHCCLSTVHSVFVHVHEIHIIRQINNVLQLDYKYVLFN